MEEELDIATQWLLGTTKKYKARVWFSVEKDDSYKVGLALKHKNKEIYKSLSKEEAKDLAQVLLNYANQLDKINSEEL